MAVRECSEVVSGGAWRVLEQDLMLLLWCELLHAGLSAGAAKSVRLTELVLCIEIAALSGIKAAQTHRKEEMKAGGTMYE